MGRKLNLTHLSDQECRKILDVIQRDFRVRHDEKERFTNLQKYVYEEAQKRMVLSRQQKFNEKHCICCFSSFGFILNRKIQCQVCQFFICKNCRAKAEKKEDILCIACIQQQELQVRACEWFYAQIRAKFRRFGSAKVVRSLYKRDTERGSGSEDEDSQNSDSGLGRQRSPGSLGSSFDLSAFMQGPRSDQETNTADVSSIAILAHGSPDYQDWLDLLRPPMSSVAVQAPHDNTDQDYSMDDLIHPSVAAEERCSMPDVHTVEDNISGLDHTQDGIFSTMYSVDHIPTTPRKLENISSASFLLNHPALKLNPSNDFSLVQIEIPGNRRRLNSSASDGDIVASPLSSPGPLDETDGGALTDMDNGVVVYTWGNIKVTDILPVKEEA